MTRIHFEDQGQDFLFWDVDDDGNVVGCEPFQSSAWVGCVTHSSGDFEVGDYIELTTLLGDVMTLKYPIEKVEHLEANKKVDDL